eukprot:209956-Pyramimonas_sp.AAC.1
MPKSSARYYFEASSNILLKEAPRVTSSSPRRNSTSSSMPKSSTRYCSQASSNNLLREALR